MSWETYSPGVRFYNSYLVNSNGLKKNLSQHSYLLFLLLIVLIWMFWVVSTSSIFKPSFWETRKNVINTYNNCGDSNNTKNMIPILWQALSKCYCIHCLSFISLFKYHPSGKAFLDATFYLLYFSPNCHQRLTDHIVKLLCIYCTELK